MASAPCVAARTTDFKVLVRILHQGPVISEGPQFTFNDRLFSEISLWHGY